MSEIAVVVPTRSRPKNISAIIDAWFRTGGFGVADLVFVIDQDDMQYEEYRHVLSGYPSALRLECPSWMPMVPKLNEAAVLLARTHPVVAFMGDDHLPRTENWANKLIKAHVLNQAGIVYGRDGIQDERLPTWWSMDSRIIRALNKMVPAPVQHMFCDNAIKILGLELGRLAYLDDVLIEHMHPLAGKAEMDAQYERVNRRQQYARDEAAFQSWVGPGLAEDARLCAGIWG